MNHREFSDRAIEMFRARYGQRPTWPKGFYCQLAQLLKLRPDLTVQEFERRYRIMLYSTVPFHQQKRGSLGYFCSPTHFDEFIEEFSNGKSYAHEREQRSNRAIFNAWTKDKNGLDCQTGGGLPHRVGRA